MPQCRPRGAPLTVWRKAAIPAAERLAATVSPSNAAMIRLSKRISTGAPARDVPEEKAASFRISIATPMRQSKAPMVSSTRCLPRFPRSLMRLMNQRPGAADETNTNPRSGRA